MGKKKKTSSKTKYRPSEKTKRWVSLLNVLQTILAIAFSMYFYTMDMWPIKYIVYVLAGIAVLTALPYLIKKCKTGMIISAILSIVMIIVQIMGIYYISITYNALEKMTQNAKVNTNEICVYVMKDDSAKELNDVKNYEFGILKSIDRKNTDLTIDVINDKVGNHIKTSEYENFLSLAAALYSQKAKAIIINAAYVDIIEDFSGYENFRDDTRCIYVNLLSKQIEAQTQEETTTIERPLDVTKDTFNVYMSGIDTTGDVTRTSRSDVNIVMSVNPVTKQILLVSTPRDYYVPLSISNGVKDKLTHAGLYGAEVSQETLEMLYGIDIDYFVRMNFTGFTDIINTLGGVNVYSEYSFGAKGYYFNAGYNTLGGDAALVFARERHSFASGDNQRGKNQMEVIKAIIAKATSPTVLDNYSSVLDSVSGYVQTNMSTKNISKLVKLQLNNATPWQVTSYSVTGSGQSQTTYTVPSARSYVMVPDESTVNEAKQLFKDVEKGKKLTKTEE